ncbi:MAG TPA: molybdopterin cofactor-binding domain-containing protein [Vicinamibacterales bacterium]|nr:molybdopterin cofactor-binding domain-containing protein [Vicinamibacterales bacterium]
MKRRDFIRLATGILVLVPLDIVSAGQGGQMPPLNYATDYHAYFHFGEDGRITCFVGRIEMGQGNMTSLAQIVADAMGVELNAIEMIMGDTARCPWDLGTFGSMSIAVFGPALGRAAAEARTILHEVAPQVKTTSVRVLGEPIPRRDAVDKVTGRATFAGDIRLPGMLYACIPRPPAHGATLRRIDTSRAERIAGVRVVRDGDLIAVLHEHPDDAASALKVLVTEWDRHAPSIDDTTIFEHLKTAAPAGVTVVATGDLARGERDAVTRCDRTYRNAYVAHAPIETHTALAATDNGVMTVWASTQAPFMVKQQVATSLGISPDRVRVITPFVGGAFGGKVAAPQAVEAARLSQLVGRPVQVMWDRAEEFFFDTFRPAALIRINSAVDADGRIVLWDADVIGAGDGGAVPFYDIPNQRVVAHGGWQTPSPGLHPFGVGAWRAPAMNSNTFAREIQMDVMASAAGVDPLAFRLRHLSDPRMRRVLEAVAERFGWPAKTSGDGHGVGLACGIYASTYVATMASLTVDRGTGAIRVNRVVCAQDMGQAVNPLGARAQMEGCITMGLGYTLGEQVRFKDGAILDRNFDTYQLPRFSALPAIDTLLVTSTGEKPSAGGEPAIICMGAVVANAIHSATGRWPNDLPITAERVRQLIGPGPQGG